MNEIETAFSARVGKEPEQLKTSSSGKPWTSFTAAVGANSEVRQIPSKNGLGRAGFGPNGPTEPRIDFW